MPRFPRGALGGHVLHILNRGNARATVFHHREDYEDFVRLLAEAKARAAMEVFAFTAMPNHFHLVGRAADDEALGSFMQGWMTASVRRQHALRSSSGHIWQGRYKSFPVQQDQHLLTVLRYTQLNPVRAGLVAAAQRWPWGSLARPELVDPWPVPEPWDWASRLLEGVSAADSERIRECIARRAPFGDSTWRERVAREMGIEASLRRGGRGWRS